MINKTNTKSNKKTINKKTEKTLRTTIVNKSKKNEKEKTNH